MDKVLRPYSRISGIFRNGIEKQGPRKAGPEKIEVQKLGISAPGLVQDIGAMGIIFAVYAATAVYFDRILQPSWLQGLSLWAFKHRSLDHLA
jgi:hypothetical protein